MASEVDDEECLTKDAPGCLRGASYSPHSSVNSPTNYSQTLGQGSRFPSWVRSGV